MRRLPFALFLAISCLCAGWVSATDAEPPLVALPDLAANAPTFDGQNIRVAGSVARIAFRPDIRGNQTVYHLELKDESGKRVSIVCTQVGFFEETDELEVLGTFRLRGVRSRGLEVPGEIDSREGEVRVLRSVREELLRRQREEMTEAEKSSVSVSTVKTGWDTLFDWSGVIATAFAIIACIPLFLRGRRFQIGLKAFQFGEATVQSDAGVRFLVLPLRLISAGAQDPVIQGRIELRTEGFTSQAELPFPHSIRDPQTLVLRFPLPSGDEHSGSSKADCIFIDHFAKTRLRTSFRLHWPARQQGAEPADSASTPASPQPEAQPNDPGKDVPTPTIGKQGSVRKGKVTAVPKHRSGVKPNS